MKSRQQLLEEIIKYEEPHALPQLREELRQYGWDSDEELVTLTRQNIISILERFLNDDITAKEVEDWADALDIRDDIEFGIKNDTETVGTIIELAGPVAPLTKERTIQLIDTLRNAPYDTRIENNPLK